MNYYEQIQKSIDYIEGNLEEPININTAANEAYMSQSNYYRMFFAMVGYSVKYIRMRRISNAAKMLRDTEESIIDIAVKYDFDSRDSFSRAFRRITRFLPSEYRRQTSVYRFERENIMDKYYDKQQDERLLEKYPDIKVLY
jgi:AraC-like DNA-binding protein